MKPVLWTSRDVLRQELAGEITSGLKFNKSTTFYFVVPPTTKRIS